MKARDLTEDVKYYKTTLEVELDDGRRVQLSMWATNDDDPSSWELARNYDGDIERFRDEISDGHYERAATRDVAQWILTKANETAAIDALKHAIDRLWGEMPSPVVKTLMEEDPDLIALCQTVHEELWHR